MCGLVGVAGDLNNKHDKVLRSMLVMDSLRGEDSTGVAFVNKGTGETTVVKALGDPFALFNENRFTRQMSKVNRVMIGHNRYATSGGVSRNTAHPFDFDTLVGVHNGTLSNKYKLLDHQDFKVDSQNLYHHIETAGLQDAINQLGGSHNAWSLVWWDKVAKTLNFLRNKERPMFMCMDKKLDVLFWASEPWMLQGALWREGIEHTQIEETEVDVHYSFPINEKGFISKPKLVRVAAPIVVVPPTPTWTNNKPPAITHTASNVTNITKVTEVKKLETQGSLSDVSYLGSKNVILEILASHRDSNGSEYLSLFDVKRPYVDIRLYPHKSDGNLFNLLGREIKGNISDAMDITDKFAVRGYYKVVPLSVSLIPEADDLAMDHKGNLIPVTEWKRTYSACNWCSMELNPDRPNRFTTVGECLCSDCAKDPEVIQYVNLV